ncbi:ac1 [Fusarium agapanthi]|uniref:Ac1 n=1 Tax=Fusarium agapanthi TaxID=1803897 RepID=A0A9P5E4P2_9HYPO|nr:ac1 [Fusarium agapanthi]
MDDHDMDHESDGSDSGYDTRGVRREDTPIGKPVKEGRQYRVHGRAFFITYTQSRVEDPEEFHACFRASVQAHIHPKDRDDPEGLQVYGVMELHSDGRPHYHVLMLIRNSVQWRNAREKVRVWITRDEQSVVDTDAINIKTKQRGERMEKFIEDTQAYFIKDLGEGSVLFGKRIEGVTSKKEDHWRQVIDEPDADETVRLIKTHYPRSTQEPDT